MHNSRLARSCSEKGVVHMSVAGCITELIAWRMIP
jgi:hypothetical protein